MEVEKKLRLEIMIDLETVSKKESAGWLEVAAVPFRFNNEALQENEIQFVPYTTIIDLTSCYMSGMDMNGCQEWWIQQDPKAVVRLINGPKKSISVAINELYNYLSAYQEMYEVEVWAQGTDFEFPKLEYCFDRFVGKEPPYHYWNKSDARTFCNKLGIKKENFEFEGIKHSSMDDCRNQIKRVNAAYALMYPKMFISPESEEKK